MCNVEFLVQCTVLLNKHGSLLLAIHDEALRDVVQSVAQDGSCVATFNIKSGRADRKGTKDVRIQEM